MKKFIYMDHAATTPVSPEVIEAMVPYFNKNYGNPSSLYSAARTAKAALEQARETVAKILGASNPNEIIFTSGGSESDNLAIKGIAMASQKKGRHIISSTIEHHAVLHTLDFMKELGWGITLSPVDKFGLVDLETLKKSIRPDTALVSVMWANNEIGTINNIKDIAQTARENNIYFHTDAVQSVGSLDINVQDLNIDALSLSAHKFYGPKGVGILYVKRGVPLKPQIQGGGQEQKRRAGTENVAGIVGLAKALELAYSPESKEKMFHVKKLRDKIIEGILNIIPDSQLTGHPELRLQNNASFVFKYVEGESILLNLDMLGIGASSGSACTSASLEPSHVLKAIGIPPETAHGSLRLTLGHSNTEKDVDYLLKHLPEIIKKLRAISPLTK